ncbi:hypothetical protein D3C76_230440 [compost metagenome]
MSVYVDFNKFVEVVQPKIDQIEQEILNEINLQPKLLNELSVNVEIVSSPTFSILELTNEVIEDVFSKSKQSILNVIRENNVTEISNLYFTKFDKPEERKVGFLLFFYCYSPDIKPEE